MPHSNGGNGAAEALAFWERDEDGEPEMLTFGTGERIAVTDRVFRGEAGALLLKWKREADAAVAKAARERERLDAEAKRLEEARLLDQRAEAWAFEAMIAGRRVQ